MDFVIFHQRSSLRIIDGAMGDLKLKSKVVGNGGLEGEGGMPPGRLTVRGSLFSAAALILALLCSQPHTLYGAGGDGGADGAGGAGGAGAELTLGEREVWGFAEFLLGQGEYYRAITEYRRQLHHFPSGELSAAARLRIGQALLLGGEPGRAIGHLEGLADDPALEPHGDSIHYLSGLSWLELEWGRPYPMMEEAVTKSLGELKAISPGWPDYQRTAAFVKAMEERPELPEKSPWLAGGLSAVVPGSGSFYVGRYAEGSLALFVNTLLIYSTLNALEREQEGLALVVGSLALAFYGGSIYAAANGAHKFNSRQQTAYLEKQRSRFGIIVERGRLAGAFRQSF